MRGSPGPLAVDTSGVERSDEVGGIIIRRSQGQLLTPQSLKQWHCISTAYAAARISEPPR